MAKRMNVFMRQKVKTHKMERKMKLLKLAIVSALLFTSVFIFPTSTSAKEKDLVDYVNTLFGTDVDEGSTSAGPALPNASIHASPETLPPDNGGYHRGNPVVGFGQLYTQGSGGTKSYGNFLLSPQTGDIKTKEQDHASPISEQHGQANYYTTKLDKYNIKAEIAPKKHSAIYRFTYPETDNSSFIIDVSRKIGGSVAMKSGSVNIDKDNKTITGGGTFGDNWNPNSWDMYFALSFDHDFTEIGTWDDKGLKKDNLSLTKTAKEHFGSYVKFDTSDNKEVNVKIAISFVSEEKAKGFLNDEIKDFDFENIKEEAKDTWNEVLGKVELGDTVDEETKKKFYTALYHTNIQPRDRTEDHGTWDDYYTLWDSWRTVFPFLQLTRPEVVAGNINSFIKRYDQNGMLSDAYIQGKEYLCGQGGNDIENIIADAYLKDIPGVDWNEAYRVAKGDAENYRSQQYDQVGYHYSGTKAINGKDYSWRVKPSSATVGFAYNDFSIASMAKGLGKEEDYKKFLASSKKWLNNWDENLVASDGYKGFIHKRGQDGSYPKIDPSRLTGMDGTEKIFAGYNDDFYEAGIWEGSYSPTFDLPTLIEKMGGKYEYADRLNFALEKGYMNFANEPSFQTIWTLATDEVQRPDLASHWVDDYLNMYTDVGYPGDEDNGAMSSMYMFMMSGFFPMSGTNNYYLHGTKLPEVTYHLGTGKDFVIKGINTSDKNIYVQSATWSGQPLTSSKLTYEQIKNGGTLEFVMGSQPSDWARVADNENPGEVQNLKLDNSQLNEGKLNLTWDKAKDNTQIKEYNIYSSTQENFELNDKTFVDTTKETSYTFEATNGTKYYAVEAVDYFANKSKKPPVIKVETSDSQKSIMTGTIKLDNRYLNVGLVKFDWEKATDNTKVKEYMIYRSTKEKYDLNEDTLITKTNDLSFSETKTKGTYFYKICAVDIYGNISNPLTLKVENPTDLTGKTLKSSVNIANGKTATVSGKTADKEDGKFAVDGDAKTKWCCKEDQSSTKPDFWLEIDLGEVYQLNKWSVKHASQSGLPGELTSYDTKDFKLQVKSGDQWLDIDTVVNNTDQITTRTTSMFEGQYIRLYITKPVQDNAPARTVRLYEFELYGDENAQVLNGSLMKNSEIIAKVNGQANDKEGAKAALDFNTTTKWSCRTSGAEDGKYWLEVQLPHQYTVDSMSLLSAGSENPLFITKEFSLQVKENGEWKNVLDVKGNTENSYKGTLSQKATGDEWRLLIPKLGDANENNARILEFHLFGERIIEKDELQKAYDANKDKKQDTYTSKSWKTFTDALKNAKTVLDDTTAIQSEVDLALTQLNDSIKNLVVAGDKTELNKMITEVQGMNKDLYTLKSWNYLQDILNNATQIVEDENATQEEIDKSIVELRKAIDSLVKKPVISDNPDKPAEPNTPNQPTKPTDKEDLIKVETGDQTQLIGYASILGVSLLASILVFKKKYKKSH
ncbi:MAG: GH92 family glycosyl hydrolase [Coprobacillus sp.]